MKTTRRQQTVSRFQSSQPSVVAKGGLFVSLSCSLMLDAGSAAHHGWLGWLTGWMVSRINHQTFLSLRWPCVVSAVGPSRPHSASRRNLCKPVCMDVHTHADVDVCGCVSTYMYLDLQRGRHRNRDGPPLDHFFVLAAANPHACKRELMTKKK